MLSGRNRGRGREREREGERERGEERDGMKNLQLTEAPLKTMRVVYMTNFIVLAKTALFCNVCNSNTLCTNAVGINYFTKLHAVGHDILKSVKKYLVVTD